MTEIPVTDWQQTPHLGAVQWIALGLTVLGGFGLVVGLTSVAFAGAALTIAGAVLFAAGGLCWSLYAAVLWWRHESRNQMLTIVAAVTQ